MWGARIDSFLNGFLLDYPELSPQRPRLTARPKGKLSEKLLLSWYIGGNPDQRRSEITCFFVDFHLFCVAGTGFAFAIGRRMYGKTVLND